MMKKILAGVALVVFLYTHTIVSEEEEDFACDENVTYILDDSFPCQCPPDTNNTLTCDLSHCPDKPVVKQNCSIGATWEKECNKCWCRMLGVVCSQYDC